MVRDIMNYKKWLILAAAIFSAGIITGLFAPVDLIADQLTGLEDTANALESISTLGIFLVILIKNALVLLMAFVLSPVLLIYPVSSLFLNGWILSAVGVLFAREESLLAVIAGILPHGIFELSAFVIAQAAALSFGMMAMRSVFSRDARSQLNANFRHNLHYLGIGMALLIPAAAIETFITPLLLGKTLGI
ncbi:putative membrane protein [Dehalococcoides sp. UCH007]|nr:putative membrane protein [Dehalococcoides sp. UCH007]